MIPTVAGSGQLHDDPRLRNIAVGVGIKVAAPQNELIDHGTDRAIAGFDQSNLHIERFETDIERVACDHTVGRYVRRPSQDDSIHRSRGRSV